MEGNRWMKTLDKRGNALSYKAVFNRSYHNKDGILCKARCTAYFVFFLAPALHSTPTE